MVNPVGVRPALKLDLSKVAFDPESTTFSVASVDKTELLALIEYAEELADEIAWNYPPIAAALYCAIDDAQEVADDESATEEDVEEAIETLIEAIRTALNRVAAEIKNEADLRKWRIVLNKLQTQGRKQQKKDTAAERQPVNNTIPRRVK